MFRLAWRQSHRETLRLGTESSDHPEPLSKVSLHFPPLVPIRPSLQAAKKKHQIQFYPSLEYIPPMPPTARNETSAKSTSALSYLAIQISHRLSYNIPSALLTTRPSSSHICDFSPFGSIPYDCCAYTPTAHKSWIYQGVDDLSFLVNPAHSN